MIEYLPLISGIFSAALGTIVAYNSPKSDKTKWPFVVFAWSVGVWSAFISLFLISNDASASLLIADIYYIAALLIACSFLLFSMAYSGIDISRAVKFIIFAPWIAMLFIIITPGSFIESLKFIEGSKFVSLNFYNYLIYSFIFIVYAVTALIQMFISSRQKGSAPYTRFLWIYMLISLTGGAWFDLILPFLGNYSLIGFGPLFTFIMVISVFYTIARHGLFDIRKTVTRATVYAMSLTSMVLIYLLTTYLFFNILLGQSNTAGISYFNVLLTLALAFLFQPIKHFFDRVTNRLFFRDSYDSSKFYTRFNQILSSTTDLRLLLRKTSIDIAETLKAEQAFIFTFYKDDRHIISGTDGHSKLPVRDAIDINRYIEQNRNTIFVAELVEDLKIKRIMSSHKLAVVLPLIQSGDVIGYLCLGEHLSSRYNSTDIRVLETISDELVIAIQNALSVEDVRDINATLQQRVDNATKELRANNELLKHLDEAKDEFVSIASHQLRTPLTSVKGYISMLIEGDAGKITKNQKVLLEEAFNSSERMVRLINDFLNVSRLQTGKFMIDLKPLNLAKVVEQELDSLKTNASSRNMKFSYKMPKNIPITNLDEGKIRQVIMNFADNALYYSHEKSTIKVELNIEKDDIVFTIKDTGIGVPMNEQSKLFTKFYRASNARKQRPDGTGVGLFMAKKVIDAHGGRVVFESVEGKGSIFGFRLPLKKVLTVDDTN